MQTIVYICSAFMLIFSVYAVMNKSIIKSAIGLALTSASLAAMMYAMEARWSAIFELSVCSGFVTVVFISGISLAHSPKIEDRSTYKSNERNRWLPLVLMIVGIVLVAAALILGVEAPELAGELSNDFRNTFWNTRQVDIWGQIAVILCGGIAVVVLLRMESNGGEK